MKNEIILFENQKIRLEVNVKDETVWLTLNQIAELFDRDKSVISRHIKNALQDELDNSVVANFATTAQDVKTYDVFYYNPDMIISVGYRVKSKNSIIFRKWPARVLREHLIKGYTVNRKRLEYLITGHFLKYSSTKGLFLTKITPKKHKFCSNIYI